MNDAQAAELLKVVHGISWQLLVIIAALGGIFGLLGKRR